MLRWLDPRLRFGLVCRLNPRLRFGLVGPALVWLLGMAAPEAAAEDAAPSPAYRALVLEDQPVAYWPLDESAGETRSLVEPQFAGRVEGKVLLGQPGPRPPHYPLFGSDERAAVLAGRGYVRVADPGEGSVLDFAAGDSITLEAWVNPDRVREEGYSYIVGKGRTGAAGFAADNQNYALRLLGQEGEARITFLFRSAATDEPAEFHRWTADTGFLPGTGWHHVAVSYTFGKSDSLVGYVDGKAVGGSWDMGGPTDRAPVVDDDELWIGSSMKGSVHSSFHGALAHVAIYRQALPVERLARRYKSNVPDPRSAELALELPADAVQVEIYEGLPEQDSWTLAVEQPTAAWQQPTLGFVSLPKKYSAQGLIVDRSTSFLVRGRLRRTVEAGEYQLLLRAKSAARLYIDGRLVAETGFMRRNSSGHEAVPELVAAAQADLYALTPGHQEKLAKVKLDAGDHVFRLEAVVGGRGLRPEIGECCVALAREGETPLLLAAAGAEPVALTVDGWQGFAQSSRAAIAALDTANRRAAAAASQPYWTERHALARREIAQRGPVAVPAPSAGLPARGDIDHFINAPLAAAEVAPAPELDDYAFLRRVTLDLVGVVPAPEEVARFLADEPATRRPRAIDRLLADPRWADHWVPYWQDVLAENPGILKPELNNTGPFRWWIHESMLDNKPVDRFVTELVMMEGSKYYGGPAGFAMASQNDAPMADKAHVLARAFLGVEMKCARCHDAPLHPFKQEELFSLAAMLNRSPIALPKTSTVPVEPGARPPAVTISLKPGAKIEPRWPFAALASGDLPEGMLRESDWRERLAATLTSPRNDRFAQVVVNRLWHRYLGRGLVKSVDDWHDETPSHPELLDYLARQLVSSGYDLKHVARLILNSHVYQRAAVDDPTSPLFAGPQRRRMSAEQIVDSLFAAVEKPMGAEMLTLDPEGRRPADAFLNLGEPARAWQFTSLSNERDRPALALPVAQSVVDLLQAFGWRDARPHPVTEREEEATVLQPLILANGVAGRRAAQLSDDNAVTRLCLEDRSVESLVDEVFLRFLSRPPSRGEREAFVELLSEGYAGRIVPEDQVASPRKPPQRSAVSWSNHLSAEATRIKLELERAAREGDPPTGRLVASWRERMEDMVWALVNSPEFVFVP